MRDARGADVIYAAAGGSGLGVFQSALANDAFGIGVDSDQYESIGSSNPELQPVILTSMLKRVDVAVDDFINAYNDGKTKPGFDVYDLKRDGVGYSTSGGQLDDIKSKIDAYKAKIISGDIKVPNEL